MSRTASERVLERFGVGVFELGAGRKAPTERCYLEPVFFGNGGESLKRNIVCVVAFGRCRESEDKLLDTCLVFLQARDKLLETHEPVGLVGSKRHEAAQHKIVSFVRTAALDTLYVDIFFDNQKERFVAAFVRTDRAHGQFVVPTLKKAQTSGTLHHALVEFCNESCKLVSQGGTFPQEIGRKAFRLTRADARKFGEYLFQSFERPHPVRDKKRLPKGWHFRYLNTEIKYSDRNQAYLQATILNFYYL